MYIFIYNFYLQNKVTRVAVEPKSIKYEEFGLSCCFFYVGY